MSVVDRTLERGSSSRSRLLRLRNPREPRAAPAGRAAQGPRAREAAFVDEPARVADRASARRSRTTSTTRSRRSFFELVLGPRLKYSSCLWENGTRTLAEAEEAMLALTCERARIEDGHAHPRPRLRLGVVHALRRRALPERADHRGLELVRRSASGSRRARPENVEVADDGRERARARRAASTASCRSRCSSTCGTTRRCSRSWPRCSSRTAACSSTSSATASSPTRTRTAGWRGTSSPPGRCRPRICCSSSSATSSSSSAGASPGAHYARTSEAWLERLAENEAELDARFGERSSRAGASSSSPAPSSSGIATAPSGSSRTTLVRAAPRISA